MWDHPLVLRLRTLFTGGSSDPVVPADVADVTREVREWLLTSRVFCPWSLG